MQAGGILSVRQAPPSCACVVWGADIHIMADVSATTAPPPDAARSDALNAEVATSSGAAPPAGAEGEGGVPDVLADGFTAVAAMNKLFPNEESLVGLDDFIGKLRRRIRKVNDEILVAVRQQSQTGSRAREDLARARGGIQDLSARVAEVKLKAEQSETKVQEICRDIRKLDYAKRHLTNTITAFRRLSMLMSAVQNLQEVADKRDYRETANLLEAVNQLASHFESFGQIPKICEIRGQLGAIKSALRATIFDDFVHATASSSSTASSSTFGGAGADPQSRDATSGGHGGGGLDASDLERLSHACRVVDALDAHVRGELVSRICTREMSAYQQIFSTNEAPSAKLEKTERRYAWMKKLLHRKRAFWDVFPPTWQVTLTLCTAFCKITKAHVSEALDAQMDDPDVANLLKALHCTLDFERELGELFASGGVGAGVGTAAFETLAASGGKGRGGAEGEEGVEARDPTEADRVRQKYEALRRERERERAGSAGEGADASSGRREGQGGPSPFVASISSCFEPHLKCYVNLEERSLLETVDSLVKDETWAPESGENAVLSSSVQTFLHIKKSLKRCSALTTGQTLFDLSRAFQKVLRQYAGRLITRLPSSGQGGAGNAMGLGATVAQAGPAGSTDWHVRFAEGEEEVVCLVINTAEYCYETVEQLEASVSKKVDAPFRGKIDLSQAQDDFSAVITAALSTLVVGLETRADAALVAMAKLEWADIDLVGDQSEYVNTFSEVLADFVPRLGALLSLNNFRFMCDKFTASFIPRFYRTVFRCKRLSDPGTQQLLLDAQAIRTLLLDLPSLGNHPLPPSYSRGVTQEMSKAENLLKVILSPPDAILSNFFALMPRNASVDIPRILELKGMTKQEQSAVLEEMRRRGLLTPTAAGAGAHAGSGKRGSVAKSDFSMPKFDKVKLKSDFMQLQGRLKASTDFSKIRSSAKNLQNKFTFRGQSAEGS